MKRQAIPLLAFALVLWMGIPVAQAATRAWLDRDRIALGESATLNVQTDQISATPDLSPLRADFDLSGQASSRQVQITNGATAATNTHVVNLTPRRAGTLVVPALQVGGQRTAPLALVVDASAQATPARGDSSAFLETEVDDPNPYVQQSVGVTLRLFYAVPLASGQLDLDAPEGASMQRVGDDVQSTREVAGRRYNVVERRFLLVPERSGKLVIPGARFSGRGVGGWMDDLLGGNSREMRASGAPRTLEVRPQPAGAPQPWLPLRDLRMRYVGAPQALRAGEAAALVVEVIAQGATQAQMPELPAPSVPGAQVFAEPPQYDETFSNGTPQVKLTRKYSLVPNGAGTLVVPGLRVAWWDVRAGAAKNASLPDLTLTVAQGTGGFAGSTLPDATMPSPGDTALQPSGTTSPGAGGRWMWAAIAFAVLWLLTLAWALRQRAMKAPRQVAVPAGGQDVYSMPTHTRADLRRVLDNGDLEEVGEVLRGMRSPPAADLDAVVADLDDHAQRQAVEQLRRARWADGDGVAARAALRAAFGDGPRWKAVHAQEKLVLPPLYPER
ncbi:MAG: protein BatD [Lysobacteraceae bacterium]|nr:MAG: protein BatD [Xanthomonadaceae bacterium]